MAILKKDIADIIGRKPPAKPAKLADGGGLYLFISASGSLLWRYDYRRRADGKRKTMSLGEYGDSLPKLDLNRARERHQAARTDVANGGDPAATKKIAGVLSDTFGDIADAWLKTRTGGKPNSRAFDERNVRYLKEGYRKAKGMGNIRFADVRLIHLSPLLKQFNKPSRIRMQAAAKKIAGFAKVHGLIDHSPFSDVNFEEGFARYKATPRPAITDENDFGNLLRKIDVYEGYSDNMAYYGLKLLALTFVRPGTVQKAEWKHFNEKTGLWTIPFDQLKMAHQRDAKADFVVPLSRQALKLLRELREITGDGRYLLPGNILGGNCIGENTLNYALWALGYKGIHCAHGFRSSASTILNRQRIDKRRRFERSLVEFQLDHQDASVRAIYDRDDCLPERVELMQFWADKCDDMREGRKETKAKFKIVA
jgi:integrase